MDVQCLGKHETAELGALQDLGAIGGIRQQQESPGGGVVGQEEAHQPDPGEGPALLTATSKLDSGSPQLDASEWRLIRNYRAMKLSGQGMLVDISEEFAHAFPSIAVDGTANAGLSH